MTSVLIVDDNPDLRALIRTLLTGVADDVRECSDGDEVLAAYDAEHADWVLVDLQMPRLNGLDAIRRLRAAHGTAQVIVVTTYDDAYWREAAFEAGACGYVVKDNLLDVRRLIEQRVRSNES